MDQWLGKKKNTTCQCRRCGFDSWIRKIPWRRKWKPTPVFLTGKSERQRSLVGCSPWGPKKVGHNLAIKTTTKFNSTTKIFQKSSLFSTVFNSLWTGSHSPLLGFLFYGTSYISAKLVLVPRTQLVTSITCCCSVAKLCPTLCNPMNCSTPGFSVLHSLLKFTQTHVHWASDAIQPSHPLSLPFSPALNFFQHQGILQWISSSHQAAKVLELQLQHQSF